MYEQLKNVDIPEMETLYRHPYPSWGQSAEDNLLFLAKNPDYLCLTGSRLYGSNTPQSDEDFRGFFMAPWEYLTTRKKEEVELAQPPAGDHKVYTLKTFVDGLLKQDTQMLEILFAPSSHHRALTLLGKDLLDNRDKFVAKTFYFRMVGYSNSEWNKAMGVRTIIPKRSKTEDDVIMDIRNVFTPDKIHMDQIIALLNANNVYEKIPSLQGMGEKRRNEFAAYGYTASSACHSLRLMNQCTELLHTGTMTFPRPEAAVLLQIKQGKMPLAEIESRYAEAKAKCDEAFATSKLPDNPDAAWAARWYEKQVAKALVDDDRLYAFSRGPL